MARGDHLALLSDLVRDPEGLLTADQRGRALDQAVVQYARDRPGQVVADVTAPGGHLVDLPAGWGPDTGLMAVEYPVGLVPPAMLTADAFRLYDQPTGRRLMLSVPATAGDTVRLTFTGLHQLTDQVDTIPTSDREAVCQYAAALLHEQLASAVAGSGSASIRSDSVDHGARTQEYAARARANRARYYELLGIDPKRARGASVVVSGVLPASDGGGRMFDRRGTRP